jgi:hypothetical protein
VLLLLSHRYAVGIERVPRFHGPSRSMESNCCTVSRAAVSSERVVAYLNDAEFPAAAPRTVFSGIRFVVLPWRVLFGISRDLDVVFFVMNTRSFFEYFFFQEVHSPLFRFLLPKPRLAS